MVIRFPLIFVIRGANKVLYPLVNLNIM